MHTERVRQEQCLDPREQVVEELYALLTGTLRPEGQNVQAIVERGLWAAWDMGREVGLAEAGDPGSR